MKLKRKFIFNIKHKIEFTIILVVLFTFIIIKMINKESVNVLEPYLENDMKKYAEQIINNSIIDNNNKEYYDDIVITDKNKNGEIIGVDFNSLKVNTLLTSINKSVLKSLYELESGKLETTYDTKNGIYTIPFYIFSNNILLKNLGFPMPFKIKLISNATSKIKTEISSYGINNALIKMFIELNVSMNVILPFITDTININTEVPVMIKIINGNIPDVYGGMYSVTSHSV